MLCQQPSAGVGTRPNHQQPSSEDLEVSLWVSSRVALLVMLHWSVDQQPKRG